MDTFAQKFTHCENVQWVKNISKFWQAQMKFDAQHFKKRL